MSAPAPTPPSGESAPPSLEERLRQQVVSDLPDDWQEGRKCPECGFGADRQKCAFELGGACPRHDPEMYDDDPYTYSPDPLCIEAAEELARLRAEIARLTAELAENVEEIQRLCLAAADAEARAARAEEALEELTGLFTCDLTMEGPKGFRCPAGSRTDAVMERVLSVRRALTEGADHAEH